MTAQLDSIDLQIIELLHDDGRMSCADLARSIGNITERSIRYRLDRLIKNKVIEVHAFANPETLGYQVVGDVFIQVEPGKVEEVAQELVQKKQVVYVACSTGEVDIVIQILARTNEELYTFVSNEVGKIPGVRKTTTSIVPVIFKDIYHWRPPHLGLSD